MTITRKQAVEELIKLEMKDESSVYGAFAYGFFGFHNWPTEPLEEYYNKVFKKEVTIEEG